MKIAQLYGKQILDSRGDPTIQVNIVLQNGIIQTADVPSGASKGSFEALELRDHDPNVYEGKGVLHACKNVSLIFNHIKNIDVENQREIDLAMIALDGTSDKRKLGANTMLGVSYACMKAASVIQNRPYFQHIHDTFIEYFHKHITLSLPCPLYNILNGGVHAHNRLDFQEFMVIPLPYTDMAKLLSGEKKPQIDIAKTKRNIEIGAHILHQLQTNLLQEGYQVGIGDEGGDSINISYAKTALNLICEAVTKAGYKLYNDISLGIDCASNSFYDIQKHSYRINAHAPLGNETDLDTQGLHEFYSFFIKNYPLIYLEDPFYEQDWEAFSNLVTDSSLPPLAISGDDLVVTNIKRVEQAIEKNAINCMIIKPNQIGTLYETFTVAARCIEKNILYVPSHRSGETNDPFITDIAVGLGAPFLKAGAPQRGERIAKYNRLAEITDILDR